MTAEEARELVANEILTLSGNDQLVYDNIINTIVKNIKSHKDFMCTYEGALTRPAIDRLRHEGYEVSGISNTNIRISWYKS
jgi:hypothetical protein